MIHNKELRGVSRFFGVFRKICIKAKGKTPLSFA
jgi:hypothetical protein